VTYLFNHHDFNIEINYMFIVMLPQILIIRRHELANVFVFDCADVHGGGTSSCSTFVHPVFEEVVINCFGLNLYPFRFVK